jgi:hypothetical protein
MKWVQTCVLDAKARACAGPSVEDMATAVLALAMDGLVLADAAAQALLARAPAAVMLAYLRAPAVLAPALLTLLLADAAAQALLAPAPAAVMLAYLRAPAVLAPALLALVLADAAAQALLAPAPAAVMLAYLRAPQSLYLLFWRLCWQILPPRSCSHICEPPQSLHLLF